MKKHLFPTSTPLLLCSCDNTQESGFLAQPGPKRSGIVVAAVVLLSITLSSCDLLGDDPEDDVGVLMPLAVGNYWAYSSWYLEPSIADTFRVEVTREVVLNDEGRYSRAYALALYRGDLMADPDYEWLRSNGPEGLLSRGGIADTDTLMLRDLLRKYPGRAGESWLSKRLVYRRSSTREFAVLDTVRVELIATDEPFETPAGTFRCYVYKYSFQPADDVFSYWNVYDYYAPGVGHVAEVIKSQAPGRAEEAGPKQVSMLYEYRINSN